MKDVILSIFGFFVFAAMVAVALWFGVALLVFIFAVSFFLASYILLRGYYLRWKYGSSFAEKPPENSDQVGHTTIIDVEYTDISDKK